MFLEKTATLYDRIHDGWKNPTFARRLSLLLTVIFLLAAAAIGLKRYNLLPQPLAGVVPTDLFAAIRLAFSLILALEVMELIFAIAESLSRAVAKQMEIMALILLREAFTDISLLGTQATLAEDWLLLFQVLCIPLAALLLYLFRGLFFRWYKGLAFNDNILTYVNAKKSISLALLIFLLIAGCKDIHGFIVADTPSTFFHSFYTALIFTDILLVLVSQYFMPCFQAVFRNSGYAAGTLLMRLALGAPHLVGALLCVLAGMYLIALTWVTSRFDRIQQE